jgi:hypothetical protein
MVDGGDSNGNDGGGGGGGNGDGDGDDKLCGQTEGAARTVDIYSFGITMYSVMAQVLNILWIPPVLLRPGTNQSRPSPRYRHTCMYNLVLCPGYRHMAWLH